MTQTEKALLSTFDEQTNALDSAEEWIRGTQIPSDVRMALIVGLMHYKGHIYREKEIIRRVFAEAEQAEEDIRNGNGGNE